MRIEKITSGAKCRMDKQFQNCLIYGILSFPNLKNSENLLIFQFVKFLKFEFRKFQKSLTWITSLFTKSL